MRFKTINVYTIYNKGTNTVLGCLWDHMRIVLFFILLMKERMVKWKIHYFFFYYYLTLLVESWIILLHVYSYFYTCYRLRTLNLSIPILFLLLFDWNSVINFEKDRVWLTLLTTTMVVTVTLKLFSTQWKLPHPSLSLVDVYLNTTIKE